MVTGDTTDYLGVFATGAGLFTVRGPRALTDERAFHTGCCGVAAGFARVARNKIIWLVIEHLIRNGYVEISTKTRRTQILRLIQ
ncbi:MAG: hypothetical protein CME02_05935 [Geminicoccus sp.]|nr:hypothetical protein [Geminicoccus sp.]